MAEEFNKSVIEFAMTNGGLALTFDDVRINPNYSKVKPHQVDVSSMLSRHVPLRIPIISAAMDRITEHKLAIEIAMEGGAGVIHRNMTAKNQAWEVERVKRRLGSYIKDPICIFEDEIVEDVLRTLEKKGYGFSSLPIMSKRGRLTIDGRGKLVGIVTGNDFDFCDDKSLNMGDIMTGEPLHVIGKCSLEEAYKHMKTNKKKALPIVDGKGKVIGMYVYSDVERVINGNREGYNVDSKGRLIVGAAIGVRNDAYRRLEKLVEKDVDFVVIDTAHGDCKDVHDTLKRIKKLYPKLDVVAGNVCMPDAAKRLVDLGADAVKVGVGPGSICTTREVTGVGRPQVSAVYFCAKAVYESGSDAKVIADGGMSKSGDLAIAVASGAHSLMLGNMLAGTDETPGNLTYVAGKRVKEYRGMGSLGAMQESASSRQRYSQETIDLSQLVPQGIEGRVPYKGPLHNVMVQYLGGLRAAASYTGSRNIKEFIERSQFDRETNAGVKESRPHNVEITKEAPNYNPQG
jgi:IMP dehydrogenase